jgi:polysaccharide export outer membrane protein
MLKIKSVNFFLCIAVLAAFSLSCTPAKNTTYFQTIPYNSELQTLVTKDFEHKVRVDDILTIEIVSPSEEVVRYNAGSVNGYLVDKYGNIQLYKIGDVKVLDLTLAQIKERITKLLVPDYFKQAAISVRFKNHKIILLGAIGAPGIISMETEHLSIIEAISARGDLSEKARKDNILVIRNSEKGKLFYRINLLDASVFNSPFYYLQADDIIYVEKEIEKNQNTSPQQIVAYVVSAASFLFLILDRINR